MVAVLGEGQGDMSKSLCVSRSNQVFRRNQCWEQALTSEAQNRQDFYKCSEVMVYVPAMTLRRKQAIQCKLV